MSTAIHLEIAASFRSDGHGGFISRSEDSLTSCPPYVIAAVAADRVPDRALRLPDGYTLDTLDQIRFVAGFVGQETHVSARQAAELADIGMQLLSLAAQGKINPPLRDFEQQSIEHLVQLAGGAS